jgi:hypothetical protein
MCEADKGPVPAAAGGHGGGRAGGPGASGYPGPDAARQTWMRRATASTISATACSTGTPFFCSPLR